MAFSDWESYVLLLDDLRDKRLSWDSASNYADFDKLTTTYCAAFKEGDRGLDSLVTALRPDYAGNDDLMYEQLRIAVLAHPGETLRDFGPDWAGYFISERLNGDEICSQSRYAAPSGWELVDDAGGGAEITQEPAPLAEKTAVPEVPAPVPVPLTYSDETGLWYDEHYWYLADGVTVVDPLDGTDLFVDRKGNRYARGVLYKEPDPRQEHFDPLTGRTRRAYADGLFEYLHENGRDWERTVVVGGQSLWGREHSASYGWLAYDQAGSYWLDTTIIPAAWRPRDEVGLPVEPMQARAAEPPAEPDEVSPAEQEARAKFDQMLADAKEKRLREAIGRIRAKGISAEKLSDEQIAAAFDETVANSGQQPATL